jgi:hypothetical protein
MFFKYLCPLFGVQIIAARQGFEPRFVVPETIVLPLDDQAIPIDYNIPSKKQTLREYHQ